MRLVASLIMTLLAVSAWAGDIRATYALKEGESLTVSYRDAAHIRLDVSADNFLLVKGEDVWVVQRDGKQWTAMNMSEMGKMMQGFNMPGMAGNGAGAPSDGGDVTFKRTSRTETVAGYEGHVYEVKDGQGQRYEVVLTDHDDVRAVSRAFVEMSGSMASKMGLGGFNPDQLMNALEGQVETGLLRQDGQMRLTAIDTGGLADSQFELPPGTRVQSMPKMPEMPQGMPAMPEGFGFPR